MIQKLKRAARKAYFRSPLFPILTPRRTQTYCVGAAKTGTSSIAAAFADRLRSRHEADDREIIGLIFQFRSGNIGNDDVKAYLRRRDRRLRLEIDSSQLNYFFLRQLVEVFPDAKFILTIRNPYAWVDSFINHQLGRGVSKEWKRLRDLRFQPERFDHPPEEEALAKKGLYTLDGYFSYWARHNEHVLETVPDSRLLVLRTTEITERANEIAAFAGVEPSAANQKRSHANKARSKFGVLAKVDQEYLAEKVETYCGDLMKQYFPEIRHPADGLPSLPKA
ncbi:MAG: hypothetical protein GVY12_03350 [Bacteroidetes bacterium]|jgi:hypothetical protein|nr:hypothetical protein [Bacteroidota bacterium]